MEPSSAPAGASKEHLRPSPFKNIFESRRSFVLFLQILLFPLFFVLGLLVPGLRSYVGTYVPVVSMADTVSQAVFCYWVCLSVVCLALVVRNLRTYYDGENLSVRVAVFEAGYHFLMLYIVATRTLQLQPLGDDAFIDYRYATHWINGMVDFNSTERVMGFTAHLHIFLLSVLAFISRLTGVSLEQLSIIANCFLQCLSLSYLLRFLRLIVRNHVPVILAGAVFALSPFEMFASAIGKEQPLGVFLMVVALLAFTRKQSGIFAWSSTALALVRPEGIFFLALAVLFSVKQMGRKWLRPWLLPVSLFALYHLALFCYFGSPFPHAAIVKSQIYTKRLFPYAAFIELVRHIGTNSIGCVPYRETYAIGKGAIYLVPGGLLVLLIAFGLKGSRVFRLYVLVVIAVLLFYSIPNSWIFNWYLLWFALLPVLLPVFIFQALSTRGKAALVLSYAIFAGTILAQISMYPRIKVVGLNLPLPLFLYQEEWGRFAVYREIGLLIKEKAAPGDLVAVTEPGLVGYYYGGPILDLGGLVSHCVVSCYSKLPRAETPDLLYAPPPEAISKFKPRFICFQDGLVTREFLESPYFKENYVLIKFWPLPIYQKTGLFLYQAK